MPWHNALRAIWAQPSAGALCAVAWRGEPEERRSFEATFAAQLAELSRLVEVSRKRRGVGDLFRSYFFPADDHRTLGRNDPCYCGSEYKYKRCHGR